MKKPREKHIDEFEDAVAENAKARREVGAAVLELLAALETKLAKASRNQETAKVESKTSTD